MQNEPEKAIIVDMSNYQSTDKFSAARRRMVEQDLRGRGINEPGVLKVMGQIHREEFVPEQYHSQAYADGPLPIGIGQTISQPYIVGLMTQELRINRYCEVLEIGTGSGYQTAILSRLAKRVYTVERFGQLSESAQAVLGRCGFDNIEFYIGDGSCGWCEEKTFDRIVITAAVPAIPEPVLKQLADGGIIVAPIGSSSVQELVVCEKNAGKILERGICSVRFVKLIGEYGFEQ